MQLSWVAKMFIAGAIGQGIGEAAAQAMYRPQPFTPAQCDLLRQAIASSPKFRHLLSQGISTADALEALDYPNDFERNFGVRWPL